MLCDCVRLGTFRLINPNLVKTGIDWSKDTIGYIFNNDKKDNVKFGK